LPILLQSTLVVRYEGQNEVSMGLIKLLDGNLHIYKKMMHAMFPVCCHTLCSYLLLHINQVDWFNYILLLQWKVSNHEKSLLCVTSLGFVALTETSHINPVYEVVGCLICGHKTNAFLFPCIHWWVLFCKAWLRDRFSTCLNLVTLLQCYSGL